MSWRVNKLQTNKSCEQIKSLFTSITREERPPVLQYWVIKINYSRRVIRLRVSYTRKYYTFLHTYWNLYTNIQLPRDVFLLSA